MSAVPGQTTLMDSCRSEASASRGDARASCASG